MTSETKNPKAALSLRDAFDLEYARRQMEERKREEAERRQQEEDLARASQLLDALEREPDFLGARALTVERRRYTVTIDHRDFRIAAYFEAGKATVTLSDKRTPATPGTVAPRKQQIVDSVEEALAVMAQFLVDESR